MDERELFLLAVDCVNRGDIERVKAVVHPEMVFHPVRAPVSGDYFGHAGKVGWHDFGDRAAARAALGLDRVRPPL